MLLAVEGLFGYAHLIKLQSKHSPNLLKAMDEISGFYKNSYGKDVKVIRSDSEAAFKACKTQLNNKGIRLFLANPGCHEGRVERFVRVLRERVRAVMGTPKTFKLPPQLYSSMLSDIVTMMNLTANIKTDNLTPQQIVTEEKIEYQDLGAPFGTVGMFKVPTIAAGDKFSPRTEVGIVIGRDLFTKGSHRVFLLDKEEYVIRSQLHMKQIPISIDIVRKINDIANKGLHLISKDEKEILKSEFSL